MKIAMLQWHVVFRRRPAHQRRVTRAMATLQIFELEDRRFCMSRHLQRRSVLEGSRMDETEQQDKAFNLARPASVLDRVKHDLCHCKVSPDS